jgi:hypothetical protein
MQPTLSAKARDLVSIRLILIGVLLLTALLPGQANALAQPAGIPCKDAPLAAFETIAAAFPVFRVTTAVR